MAFDRVLTTPAAPPRRYLGIAAATATAAISALLAMIVALAALAVPAAAHTELLQASPGPGQRAGGEIDFIDLAFFEPVTDASVEVVHDGESVGGSMSVTDGSIVRFDFDEPLSSTGTYEVTYRMTSFDLDLTEAGFSFTFEPDAPQALRLGVVEPTGRNWVAIIATVVLISSLVGLAFVFLSRLEAKRRLAASTSDPGGPGGER